MLSSCGAATHTSAAEDALRKLHWGFPVAVNGAGRECHAFNFAKVDAACGATDRTEPSAAAEVLRMAGATASIDTSRTKRRVRALIDLWYARDDSAALTRSVQAMRSLLEGDSASSTPWTDLSAALLMQYAMSGNSEGLLEALNAACEATQLNPKSTDAAWNRAVAETWLGLRDESERAWTEYAHVSSQHAPQIDYARDPLRLQPREIAMAGAWREASRTYLWRTVLPEWGDAILAGDSLRAAKALADIDLMMVASTDSDFADSPRALRQLLSEKWSTKDRDELAHGFVAMRDYRLAFDKSNWAAAGVALARAQAEGAFEHKFSIRMRYESANLLMVANRPDSSRKLLVAIQSDATREHPVIARLAQLSLANADVGVGQQAVATDEFRATIASCQQFGDEDCVLAAEGMSGAAQLLLGDSKRAIEGLVAATIRSANAPPTPRRWTALNQLRLAASLRNMPGAASALDAELEPLAERLHRVNLQLISARQHADFLLGHASLRDAAEGVNRFLALYESHADDSERAEFRGEWFALRGGLALRDRKAGVVLLLDSAVVDATKSRNRVRRQTMLFALARGNAELGDSARALKNLDTLLTEMRDRVRTKANVFERTRLAELNRNASSLAARLLLGHHDARGALNALSDRAFNASLPIQARQGVMSFAARELGDSTIVWYGSNDTLHVQILDVRIRDVRTLATRFDSTSLAQLYTVLFTPWLSDADARGAHVLRLDVRGTLTSVPWAALRNPKDGKYVADSFELRGVVNAFSSDAGRDAANFANASVLIVDAAPRLGAGNLPGAVREMKTVQALWGARASTSSAVVGLNALARGNGRASIIHFAGHSRFNAALTEESALVVPTAHADSLVFASTIAKWSLSSVGLFVLSSCDSRAGSTTALGGFDSLAGALLFAGAQSVIGAAWPVDDDATVDLMKVLHKELRSGASAGVALQRAQLQLIRSSDPTRNAPRVWAAFQLLGS